MLPLDLDLRISKITKIIMVTMENKERNWHNSKYIDKGNTCAQDTFFFCSEVYNPKKYFATIYTYHSQSISLMHFILHT